MMPHAVLSRRGAFGLAAMLTLVRPAPAGGVQARLVAGEVLQLNHFTQGASRKLEELGPKRFAMPGDPGEEGPRRAQRASAVAPLPAPWGWDTLENVR